jgi:hypothetical protein
MRYLALLALVTACGTSIHATTINPAPHAMRARPPEAVELFTSGPPQDRRYVDIAFLEAEQDSPYSFDDTAEFFSALRARAGAMGCDGVVIGSPTNKVTTGLDLQTPENIKGIVGTCIVFVDAGGEVTAHR